MGPVISKTAIRPSLISGTGTFATRSIARGELIMTLAGEQVQTDNIDALCIQRGMSCDDPLQIGDETFLLLDYPSKVINHRCLPNAGMRNQSDLYAIRPIAANEEITYDYSTTVGINDHLAMPCRCSTPLCRHIIGNILTIPSAALERYAKLSSLPTFIREQLVQHAHPRLKTK